MQYEKWIKSWKSALAENFFLRVVVLLLCFGLILNATFFNKKDRVIIVPPQVTKEFWLEKDKASPEYVEQMAVFFAELGGNLSPSNAEFNAHTISEYLTPSTYAEVKADLASHALYLKKNNVSQSFYPSSSNINGNQATIVGKLVRFIGPTKISDEGVQFRMLFETRNYRISLKEFYIEYPDRQKGKNKDSKDEGWPDKEGKDDNKKKL